jgi:hypothetical protein
MWSTESSFCTAIRRAGLKLQRIQAGAGEFRVGAGVDEVLRETGPAWPIRSPTSQSSGSPASP